MGDPSVLDHTLDEGQRALLADLARRLRAHFGEQLERVVVFGSRARGDITEDSDIDVLVLVRGPIPVEIEADRAAWRLLSDASASLRVWAPISLIVFAEERFAELKRRERRFALDVEAEGIPL